MITVKAKYSAKADTGSRIDIECELPVEINQMIVFAMMHQADAMSLLPAYNELLTQSEEREGSAKNHRIEV